MNEQLGKKTFIIFAGRFHPFHKGHKSVYDYLKSKFSGDNVYITTTNKVELPKSPFSFDEKKKMMELTGVPANKILNVKRNYNVEDIMNQIPLDLKRDSIIFAVSEKDMAEDPRFSKFTKKDGSPAYLQPYTGKALETADKHGYIVTTPTTDFNVLGKPARSASELRKQYVSLGSKERELFISDLFGGYNDDIKNILDSKLDPIAGQLTERQKNIIKKLIRKVMSEDLDTQRKKVADSRKRANNYLAIQKQEELKLAQEELKDAQEKLDNVTDEYNKAETPEKKKEKSSSVESAKNSVDSAEKNVDSKQKIYRSAVQVKSAY